MRRVALALSFACLLAPFGAAAQGEALRLMREPHSYVDVVDAFDDADPFDINVTAAFVHRWEFGTIQRERGTWAPGPSDPNRLSFLWENIARHERTQNILELGLEVGIFRDLEIYGRMPIILSDDRSLSPTSDFRPGQLAADDTIDECTLDATGACIAPPVPDGMDDLQPGREANPPPLFDLANGFAAPTRYGVDYIAAGIAWSIFNQHRERELPTWVIMLEGRFNVGDPLTACQNQSGSAMCRQWSQDAARQWSFTDDGGNAGISQGTNALRIEMRSSWRTEYVEPFAGLVFQIEWPANAEQFYLPAGNLSGIINDQPPIFGEFVGGVAIIPWENRADWQRFTIDLRVMGRYVSEGHGYSPLFDALGTSQNRYLTEPALEGQPTDPVTGLPTTQDLREVPFFGLTDTASHGELGGYAGVEVRAARYVRFAVGAGLWYIEPYLITYADACNPNVDNVPDNDARRGTCRSGIINPDHRPAIDLPGQRFRADEQIRLELSVNVTGMF